ncbi:hypothetical protein [Desulfitobacterium sp. AusDCA]|uniref:hypothetical protein n=1 Tax=Desulfitobacterium sp. AusDCA TaxID=3240383 RepID=UPI003DA72052
MFTLVDKIMLVALPAIVLIVSMLGITVSLIKGNYSAKIKEYLSLSLSLKRVFLMKMVVGFHRM